MKFLFAISLFINSQSLYSQEVNFFRDITCEPTKKENGHSLKMTFSKSIAYLKIFEYEKSHTKKVENIDLFPTKRLEAHIFLSRKFCQFHVISRRPSVNSFHFVMNVERLKDETINFYEGPAHFNFFIDKVSPLKKEHKLVTCVIHGLQIPGYYYHSCKKKKDSVKPKKDIAPTRTEPRYQYYQDNDDNYQGGSSSQ